MATPNPCGRCGSTRYYKTSNYGGMSRTDTWFCGNCHTMLDFPDSGPGMLYLMYFIAAVLAIGVIGLFIFVRSSDQQIADRHDKELQQQQQDANDNYQQAYEEYQTCYHGWNINMGSLQEVCGDAPTNRG